MYVDTKGNVGIGTPTPQFPLHVIGNVKITNLKGAIHVESLNGSYTNNVGLGNIFNAITTGFQNTSIGSSVGQNITSGFQNTSIGSSVGQNITSGSNNTAVGYNTLSNSVGQINNTAIGALAFTTPSISQSTAIGYNAQPTTSNQVVLGTATEHVYIPGTAESTDTISGAFRVNGGAGIRGNLFVGGNVVGLTLSALSDYRIKANVITLGNFYSVDELKPVQYMNRLSGKTDMGFIAHEVQDVFPNLVEGIKDGVNYQSLNYNGLIAVLVKELKDVKSRLSIAENQIQVLLSKIE
jgi:hypothetical protein